MSRPRVRSLICLAALTCAVSLALPALAGAAITVNTTADQAPSASSCQGVPGDCSLRQAISWAGELADGTVILPAGHYTLTLKDVEEEANESGDLDITNGSQVQILGAGARNTVIDAAGLEERVFDVHPTASLVLSRLTVTGGEALDRDGGGILSYKASLTLDQVAVRGSTSTKEGAGGGLFVEESEVFIDASLIAENLNSGNGGGVYSEESELALLNSTIANNVVDTSLYPEHPGWGAYGGGLEAYDGFVALQNVTIAGNSIRDGNGGGQGLGAGLWVEAEESEVLNTIVYGNTGEDVQSSAQCAETEASLRLQSAGHNLEQEAPADAQRCFETPTDLIGDPRLGPLANNGGETDTLALLTGSPAINAADAGRCPGTDQRGLPRPSLGGCDIGAFEVQPTPSPKPPVVSPAPVLTPPAISRKGKVVVKKAGKTFRVKPGFTVSCPATDPTCTGSIKVKAPKAKAKGAGTSAAKKVLIGKATFSVAPGKTKKLSLKLNAKGAKMLRLLGKVRGTFAVTSHAGTGPAATAQATLKLKLPPSPRKR
ncbi:MAG: choice-of-anchor Q domain-containing protein [Solirubrobacterales bacterium]